jgi:hypothetical protein
MAILSKFGSNWATHRFQTRRFLCEFPIGSYVKLSSAVGAVLVKGQHRPLLEIHIKTILSGTSSSIRTKLWWNSHLMVLFQNCVRQSCSPTKMAAAVQLLWYFIFEISSKPSFAETVLWRVTQFFYHLCSQFRQKASGWINKTLQILWTCIFFGLTINIIFDNRVVSAW